MAALTKQVNYEAISRQPSAISYQPSVISYNTGFSLLIAKSPGFHF
jgi:hypothetical protein